MRIRRVVWLALVSVMARAPGFLIPVLIAAFFGAGSETDAYFIAYNAVLLIGGSIGQGVEVAIVPFAASQILQTPGTARTYLARAAVTVAVLGILAWLVGLFLIVPSSPSPLRGEIVKYAVFLTPLAVAWCAAAIFSGALLSQDEIAAATGSMLFRGAGALVGLGLAPTGAGLGAVSLGLSGGELLRLAWLRRRVLRHTATAGDAGVSSIRPLARAATAQVFAGAAGNGSAVVERLLAATIRAGSASYLEYATRLLVIPTVLFDAALGPLLLSRWSRHVATTGTSPKRPEVHRAVLEGMGVALVCGTGIAVLAPIVVRLLLQYGRFGGADVAVVAHLLRALAVGFVGSMGALLMERVYMSAARNHLLARLSLVRAALRVCTAVLLLPSRGLLAFAFGYAVAEWCYLGILVALLPSLDVWPKLAARPREG